MMLSGMWRVALMLQKTLKWNKRIDLTLQKNLRGNTEAGLRPAARQAHSLPARLLSQQKTG